MAESTTSAYREGFRYGKLGWPASQSPNAAGDMRPEARDWRRGWTAGNAIHREAIEREEAESRDIEGPSDPGSSARARDLGGQ